MEEIGVTGLDECKQTEPNAREENAEAHRHPRPRPYCQATEPGCQPDHEQGDGQGG